MTPTDRPLAGLSVVVCRAAEDADGLIDALTVRGARPISVPLHRRTAATDGGEALGAAVAALDTYDWLAVTSANGVRAVIAALDGRPIPATTRIAAVGPATAAALAAVGLAADVVPDRATAADLALAVPAADGPTRVLAPLAADAGDDLAVGLAGRGHVVDRVEAYRMEEPPPGPDDAAAVAGADAVLLTSPSIVDRFVARFGTTVPRAICIGPRTAARAAEHGLSPCIEAEQASETGLVRALIASLAVD